MIKYTFHRFQRLCESEISDLADFLIVYIEEAHPAEKKHFAKNIEVNTHHSLTDRVNAAKMLITEACGEDGEEFPCPVVVDTMDNATNYAYGALPERLYIIKDGKVAYVGGEGPFDYRPKEMEQKLRELLGLQDGGVKKQL